MARMQVSQLTALCFCLVTLSQFYFTMSSRSIGFSLKLVHRDSPRSPLYQANLTYLERMERLIRSSKARGYYLENISRPNATMGPTEILNFPTTREHLAYIVLTAIGSQSTELFLLFDTGSGLIWTQCKPCKNCFNQRSPIYDFQTSTTYRMMDCEHPLCSGKNPSFDCVLGHCVYKVSYGGGASTRGIASFERFLFHVEGSRGVFIGGIVFGCSLDNRDFAFSDGSISGILGLDKSPESLISQLSSDIDRRFSYCLAPFSESGQDKGFLRFGDDIPPPPKNSQMTRFVDIPGRHFYYLNLLDISVGDVRLGFSPKQFKVRRDGSGGFFIDSGVTISQIDQSIIGMRNAYRTVMASFEAYYDSRNLQKEVNGTVDLELCYKYPPGFTDFATMTYHFEEADYHVDAQYRHFPGDESVGYFCVALMPGNGVSVLGIWHQQNMRITYDVNINGLHFGPEDCFYEIP